MLAETTIKACASIGIFPPAVFPLPVFNRKEAPGNLKRLLFQIVAAIICSSLIFAPSVAQSANQSKDARAAVNSFFLLLKAGAHDKLYEFLPSELQRQITREQLSFSLKRLDSFIAVERLEIGRVQRRGDFAVVDTTIYGRLKKPLVINGEQITEGRVAAQQFLFQEGGQWKIATADSRAQSYFLKRNPEFSRQFQLSQPRFEFKQKGKWAALNRPARSGG